MQRLLKCYNDDEHLKKKNAGEGVGAGVKEKTEDEQEMKGEVRLLSQLIA